MTIEEYKEIIRNNIYYHPSLETMILGRKLSIPKKHSKDNKFNGHEYVDLGLPSGTLWATMNVGATTETEYGNYYRYGTGAATYEETDYESAYNGTEDRLPANVDTASVVWGGDWYTPTKEQCQELINNTTMLWVMNYQDSGINGATFTANGQTLFIPAAGYRTPQEGITNSSNVEEYSYIRSSNHGGDYVLVTSCYSNNVAIMLNLGRTDGYSVRPVIG